MGPTASDVIALAQNTKALSREQLEQILELAPDMDEDDLIRLKAVLQNVGNEDARKKEKEELAKKIASGYSEWTADKNRKILQAQEKESISEDSTQAEAAIQKI